MCERSKRITTYFEYFNLESQNSLILSVFNLKIIEQRGMKLLLWLNSKELFQGHA